MRYALVNGEKVEAQKGLIGICPGCRQPVIAKCGEHKIHHWAHKSQKECDNWWEPETEWHRTWKDNFPKDWQEIFLPDPQTGENHIADVRTPHGLVVEFQHSHIDPKERLSREQFYRNMIWVVNGNYRKRDSTRFSKGIIQGRSFRWKNFLLILDPSKCFPKPWTESARPVFYDFAIPSSNVHSITNYLACLLPVRLGDAGLYCRFLKQDFIKMVKSGEINIFLNRYINIFKIVNQQLDYNTFKMLGKNDELHIWLHIFLEDLYKKLNKKSNVRH